MVLVDSMLWGGGAAEALQLGDGDYGRRGTAAVLSVTSIRLRFLL